MLPLCDEQKKEKKENIICDKIFKRNIKQNNKKEKIKQKKNVI